MNPIARLHQTPRGQWTRQILGDWFAATLDAQTGHILHPASAVIEKAGIDIAKRQVSGIANVEEISRSGIKINIEGIDLSHFKKNPVALAAHQQTVWATAMPAIIAMVGRVFKKEGALHFSNMTFDTDPLAEAWFQKIVNGFVNMVSVGIMPTKWEYMEEPPKKKGEAGTWFIDIAESELFEISPVGIGANRGAFIDRGESASAEVQALEKRIAAIETSQTSVQKLVDRINQAIEAEKVNRNAGINGRLSALGL